MKKIHSIVALTLSVVLSMGPVLICTAAEKPLKTPALHSRKAPARSRNRRVPPRKVQIPEPVEGQSSTPLTDGGVLRSGGLGPSGPTTSLTVTNPRTGRSKSLPNMRVARAWHTATMLSDGRVFIFGGVGPNQRSLKSAALLDPESGEMEELRAPAGLTARSNHTATLLTDGRVLIVGGVSDTGQLSNQAQLWDLKTRTAESIEIVSIARQKHRAVLLTDGNVLLEGGIDESNNELRTSELFNVETKSFVITSITSDQGDSPLPYLAASVPADQASAVPVDSVVALRFSNRLPVEAFKQGVIKFETAAEGVATKIVAAENGRLAFITPLEPLRNGTTYTVTVSGSADRTINFSPASFSFTTVPDDISLPDGSVADGDWNPGPDNLRGNWTTKEKRSIWQDQTPLLANPGETALSGHVLTLKGQPLPDVTLSVAGQTTRTDQTGRFLLRTTTAGHLVMIIDGRTASRPGRVYGIFRAGVDVKAQQTNVLPFTIWMPKLAMAQAVNIPSPNKQDIVVTTPQIPGLELHLPAGTVIRDLDGQPVTQLSITPVPTDRPPFPLPSGLKVPVFASIQPGGAAVIPPRARLIYPNYDNEKPGTRIDFWNYDPAEKGWYIYGHGTVTPNGKQIVPDPGVVIYEFNGIMISSGGGPPDTYPEDGDNDRDGDPVDLSTGLFILERTDFFIPDIIPMVIRRTYRPGDTTSRAFGIGASHPYDMFLWSDNNYEEADLILADGGKIHYTRISAGTGFADAVYEHTTTPGIFYKTRISWNGTGWDLRLKDGTVLVFPEFEPLGAIRDRYGNELTISRVNDVFNHITQITSSSGRWLQFTYGSGHRVSQITDNSGQTVSYTYDGSNRLWKVTAQNGEITEYTYDSSHRMLTVEDAKGIVYLTNEYDSNGRVITQTHADTTTYEFDYTLDGSGKVTQTDVTDPRGNVRRLTFNSNGYTLTDTRAEGTGLEQTFTYERESGTNLILSITDPLSRETAYAYDSVGNITSISRLEGTVDEVTTSYTYEPIFNQLATITDPLSHTTTLAYNVAGTLASVTDALTHQITFTYNAMGQALTATTPLSHTTTFAYDGGDLVSITDPLSRTRTREYDPVGRLIRTTNAAGNSTVHAHDGLNQRTSTTDSRAGVTGFTYDENGNLLSLTDARSGVTSWVYDDMDRVTTRTDPLSNDDLFDYDANGNLIEFTDREGQVTTFAYDALDRVTEITFDDTSTITYTYDLFNRVTQVVDSVGGTITYEYDDLDRLTEETTPQGEVTYTYDDAGRRTSMTVDGQTAINYTYDNANRLTQITQGSATVTIAYDNSNRRTSLTLPNAVVTEYTYDNASQLTGLTYKYSGSTLGSLTYTYDAAGRRTSVGGSYARTGLPSAVGSATYNAANQQTAFGSLTLTYDLNGNLTGDGTDTFSWNARNQLSSISGGTSASFGYDAWGRRKTKTVSSTTTNYLFDGLNIVQELSGSTPTANILTGGLDEIFTRTDSGTTSFLPDALGSIIALTNSSGSVQTEYTYEPFGKTSTSGTASSNPSQFTARENDGTGLYFYRARYYSPSLQRFICEDPLGLLAGPNLYAYVNNAPLDYNDPLGLDPPQDGGHGAPQQPGGTVQAPHPHPEGVAIGGAAALPSELIPHHTRSFGPTGPAARIGSRAFPVAGGMGEVAPGLYWVIRKKQQQQRDMNDLCCMRKMGCCEREPGDDPHDPNDPNDPNNPNNPNNPNYPYDPNNPYGPGSPYPDGRYPLGGRKN